MVVRTKKKDYVISDVKKGVIQDKAKLIYSELIKYKGQTIGIDEFCGYGAMTDELWCICYTDTFLAVDYLEELNNRLTEFFERIGRIDLHCKILSIITFVHKSIHELRYSVNQDRDFAVLRDDLIMFIMNNVREILKGSSVNLECIQLYGDCVQVVISKGRTITGCNIYFDDVINSMNKFINYMQGKDI